MKSEDKQEEDVKVLHWCKLLSFIHTGQMTFPYFLNMILLFGKGHADIGFCGCKVCESGYREFLAEMINLTENKKLKPNSKEVVIKARERDAKSFKFDLPNFFKEELKDSIRDASTKVKLSSEEIQKIPVELDAHIIEDMLVKILGSEKGQIIIRKSLKES